MAALALPTIAQLLAAALSMPPGVDAALADGTFTDTPPGFRIIALSHIADGCAARVHEGTGAARDCVTRALARATEIAPDPSRLEDGDGLWVTHLALILGAAHATGPCLDPALHVRVADALARATRADPHAHAASYRTDTRRWPADQAATLAALARFDSGHGTALVDEPLARYRAVLERRRDRRTSLPWSELSGRGDGALPRGCAVAYAIRYLSEVDPALARAWWTPFRSAYLVDHVVLVGFREWPPGVTRGADVDSGPIVKGVGAAATAFGIAAARAMGDTALAARLEETADVVGKLAHADPEARRVASSTLAQAIRFAARAQPVAHE